MNPLDIILSSSLFLIMIGLGLSIKFDEFIKELKRPKELLFGFGLQLFLFPLITLIIVLLSPLNDLWKVGFIILAACPSGVLSNLLTAIFKGKTALSIEVTVVNSFISLISLSIYPAIAIKYFFGDCVEIALPLFQLISYLLLITILPAIIGAVIRHKNPELAKKIHKRVRQVGTFLFLVIVFIKFFIGGGNDPIPLNHIKSLTPWVILLNIVVMLIGYFLSRLLGWSKKASITFSSELGIQNTTFALIITETILKQHLFGAPALLYAITSLPVSWAVNYILTKYVK